MPGLLVLYPGSDAEYGTFLETSYCKSNCQTTLGLSSLPHSEDSCQTPSRLEFIKNPLWILTCRQKTL